MSEPQAVKKPIREIRIDPVVPSESVLVATARSLRPKKPEHPHPHDARPRVEDCPFCKGNEAMTPEPVAEVRDESGWKLRIVENKYAVLGGGEENSGFAFGLQQTIDGYGRHEVIIDHSSHGIRIHEMTEDHLALLLSAYRERMHQLYHADERIRYVMVFKNFGPAAGASIGHTHSQIIAMPVVPHNVGTEVFHGADFHRKTGKCIFCTLIDEAMTFEATIYDRDSGEIRRKINVGQSVVERSSRFIAIKPFASRFEWEMHILPLKHSADFLDAGEDDIKDLAYLLKRTMSRINSVLDGAQYNFFIHSVPHGGEYAENSKSFHWHMEICPRTSVPTGFELGSGLFVNTISPEDAAERLRNIKLTAEGGLAGRDQTP